MSMLFIDKQVLSIILLVTIILLLIVLIKNRQLNLLLKEKNNIVAHHLDIKDKLNNQFKNNLQVIYSLINLHLKNLSFTNCEVKFRSVKKRINVFFKIYHQIFENDDINNMNLNIHGSHLILNIYSYYKDNDNTKIELFINDKINVNSDVFTSFGLIINELISNTFKHNPDKNKNEISFHIKPNKEKISFTFTDALAKINVEEILKSGTINLGFHLIKRLANQIGTEANFNSDENGLQVDFTF